MTRTQLRAFVRTVLQEPSAKKWTDAVLDALLDDATEHLWSMLANNVEGAWYEEESTAQNIVSGTERYAWPTKGTTPARNMMRLTRVERVNVDTPYDLDDIPKSDRHAYLNAGSAVYSTFRYYQEPPYIVLVPSPTVSETGALVYHGVFEHGNLQSDADSPRLPTRFHRLVAYYAAMMALGLDETAATWPAPSYASGVAQMISDCQTHEISYTKPPEDY